jgi:hypothetical protein
LHEALRVLIFENPQRPLAAGGARRGRLLWRLRCSAWGRARLGALRL